MSKHMLIKHFATRFAKRLLKCTHTKDYPCYPQIFKFEDYREHPSDNRIKETTAVKTIHQRQQKKKTSLSMP